MSCLGYFKKRNLENIYRFTPFLVFFIYTLFLLYLNNNYINNDGIGYLVIANLIGAGNIEKAIELNVDLFFPNLIFLFSKYFFIDLFLAAKLITLIFFLIFFFFFSSIIRLLLKDKLANFISLISLICFYQLFDKYLPMIIREPGFWAAGIGGIFFYLKSFLERKPFFLIYSIMFFVLASLFRTEGLFFALSSFLVLTIVLLANIFKQHNFKIPYKKIINYIFIFFVIITLLSYFYFSNKIYFHRINEIIERIGVIFNPLDLSSNDKWLIELIKDNPLLLKVSFYSSLFTYKLLNLIGVINILIISLSFKSRLLDKKLKVILLSAFCVTLVPPLLNLFSSNVISSRYLILSSIVLFIFHSIGIHYLFFQIQKKLIHYLFSLFILINVLFISFDKQKLNEEKEIVDWFISNNIKIESIFIDNMKIRFYFDNYDYVNPLSQDDLQNNKYSFFVFDSEVKYDLHSMGLVKVDDDSLIRIKKYFIYRR